MLATIMISILLFAVVALIIWNMIRKKRSGKSASCGCGCSSCAAHGVCHKH